MALKPNKIGKSLVLFIVLLFFPIDGVPAAEDVVYKGARKLKVISEAAKTGGDNSEVKFVIGGKQVDYAYNPEGKTDPFKSFIALMEEMDEKKRRKPKTYLETLDLSQLELIAVIVGRKGNWAMVREAKGTGHVIRRGTAIGTKGGTVHKISDREVTIREEYKDFRGRTRFNEVKKKVPALK